MLESGGLAETEAFSESLLCLPSHPYLTEDEQDQIIDSIQRFVKAG